MPVKLRCLLDNDVPDSVGAVLVSHGHTVIHVRDILPTDLSDPLVATVSELEGTILVTCDSDYKVVAPRIPKGHRARFRKLSRIALECTQPQASKRMQAAMSFIEHEFEETQKLRDKRYVYRNQKERNEDFALKTKCRSYARDVKPIFPLSSMAEVVAYGPRKSKYSSLAKPSSERRSSTLPTIARDA